MDAFRAWAAQLQWENLWEPLVLVAASIMCITVHETCHGLMAYRLGDPTAKNAGRLTLNPLKHIDLLGLIMMAALKFGWAKPVPVDPRYFKKPKRDMALTALAGPVSNVLLAWIAMLFYSVTLWCLQRFPGVGVLWYLYLFFWYMAVLSAGLAVFNMFPIPPLDGSKVLFALLPNKAYAFILRYERYGMLVLLALLYFGGLDKPLAFLRDGLLGGLSKAGLWPYDLLSKIFS